MFILIGTVLKALHSFMSNNSSLSLMPQVVPTQRTIPRKLYVNVVEPSHIRFVTS